jgi:glycosyltransferase involved in cell wall biosynthesis
VTSALRILHAVPRGGPGGAQLVATRLAGHQRAAGHEVHVASGPPALAWDGHVHRLPRLERGLREVLPARAALARVLAEVEPDVVHCHGVGLSLALSLATRRGRSVACCTTLHGIQAHEFRSAAPVMRFAGLPIVAVSPVLEERVRQHRVQSVRTIENGVAPATSATRGEVQRRWPSLPADAPLVVSAGRLVPDKLHDALLEAVAGLPDVALLLVGDGISRPDLERRVGELGVSDRVVVAGWQPDASALVGAADVAVQPSNTETGLSLSALEALHAKRPLITGSSPTFRAYLRDGEDALIVDGSSPTALAAAIRAVLDDPTLAARLVDGGSRAAASHTLDVMAGEYEALYRELIERAERRR